MDIRDTISIRRSIKEFTARAVSREQIDELLALAVLAPNHRLTNPWRFRVLGPDARRAWGEVRGMRKAAKLEDAAAKREMIEKNGATEVAIPASIAVSMVLDASPEIREEDYAAVMMAVGNILLAAPALGLGTHLRTGAVLDDARTREALGVPDGERLVAIVQLGEPAVVPEARPRRSAAELTVWLA